jgi:hypothetical protein
MKYEKRTKPGSPMGYSLVLDCRLRCYFAIHDLPLVRSRGLTIVTPLRMNSRLGLLTGFNVLSWHSAPGPGAIDKREGGEDPRGRVGA